MTTTDKIKIIGKTGLLAVNGLKFEVEILDVRDSFGRTDYKVKPVSGEGTRWVSSESVTLNK
jgi:hypothetical protein